MPIKYMCFLLVIVALVCGLLIRSASGEYRDPTTKVNVNEQTDLFEKSVENLNDLQDFITNSRDEAVQKVESGNVIDELGFDRNEINQEKNNLSSIEANDLNSRGQVEMMKQNDVNDLYVDYSRPLNKKHMQDAKKIASAQNGLMRNLLGKLRELGVDCKTVKGNKEKELTYYLQIVNEPYKDTIYNQVMCEDLRNKYNCNDSLALRCVKRGTSEIKHIAVPIDEIPSHWFKDNSSLGTLVNSWMANLDSANNSNEISNFIKSKIGKNDIIIPDQKIDMVLILAVYSIKHGDVDHSYYQRADTDGMHNGKIKIRLHYIEGDSGLCLEWSEDWNEECRPQ